MSLTAAHYIEFGERLREQREARGLSVEAVGKTTKIPPTLLVALEAGHVERLPARVFMLNYLRSYAEAIGISADDTVKQYQDIPGAPTAERFVPAELEVARRHTAWTTVWLVAAALFLGTFAFALNVMSELAVKYTHR